MSPPKNTIYLRDIQEYFLSVNKIIMSASYCVHNLKELHSYPGGVESLNFKIKNMLFFRYYSHHMFFISVIELTKLFAKKGESHHFCFTHLFNRLENWAYCDEFRSLLNSNKISPGSIDQGLSDHLHISKESIVTEVNSLKKVIEQNAQSIIRLLTIRDKLYAHYDKKNPEKVLSISYNDIERLLNLSKSIYNNLYGRIFYSESIFDFPDPKVKSIIQMIEKGYDL